MAPATMVEVMRYFDMTPATFKKEWSELSDQDKMDLKNGVGNGSLTY